MNKIDAIDHVAIQVQDIAQGVKWYQDNFDCEVIYQDESWAFIGFKNIKLALVLPQQHPYHIAFEDEEAERHGKLTNHRDGSKSIYVKDPFGNNIEYVKYKKED